MLSRPSQPGASAARGAYRQAWLLGLAWAGVALGACGGGGGESNPTGQVAIALQASVAGTTYRLSEATLNGTGAESFTLESSDDASVSLQRELSPGAYNFELAPGWVLEQQSGAAFSPITATLASANPVSFSVVAAQIARVGYAFEAGGVSIDLRQATDEDDQGYE